MTLKDLHTGESGIILRINGSGAFRKRITEMGFVKGQKVKVIRSAPFRDPVEYLVMSTMVSLRRSEAELIEVQRKKDYPVKLDELLDPVVTQSNQENWTDEKTKKISVALIGNPNCGKTTLYNRLSRSHERVGNYSGVTVDKKETKIDYKGYEITFTDLPGTYSLSAYSADELVVRNFLNRSRPDVVVNVVDAGSIERHLYLTTQLIDMGISVVLALNMYDDLEQKGDKLNLVMLGKLLGMPIVPTIGKHGKGIYRLLNRIIQVQEKREPITRHIHINYGKEIEQSIGKIEQSLYKYEKELTGRHIRYFAIRALEKDDYCIHFVASLPDFEEIRPIITDEVYRLEQLYKEDSQTMISDARYAFIRGALKETLKKSKKDPAYTRSQKIDKILTHKYLGFPIFLLILYVMFQATFTLGQYPMHWIELGVERLGSALNQIIPEGIFNDLVIDGIIGGVGGVIVFLPNILILFFIISLMEDTGYMARTAFIMDRLMHLLGLHGKSFIPLIMGFGCNVPAIMATRMLENRRDRMLTMLIIPFMSCSARLPVYILIAGAIFPGQAGNIIFLMYLVGIVFSILMAIIFKTTLFKKSEAPFVMELPLYRRPGFRVVLRHMWSNSVHYLKKMGGVILIASLIIWTLGYFPRHVEYKKDYAALIEKEQLAFESDKSTYSSGSAILEEMELEMIQKISMLEMEMESEKQENSYIGRIGKIIEPLIEPLGFDWKIGVSLVAGFAAKEVVVSTMGVLYQADDADTAGVSLQQKIRDLKHIDGARAGDKVFTPVVAMSFLMFVLLYLPCIAVITAIGREGGGWKWSFFVIFYTTALAWLVSFCVYQIGSLF